MDIIKEKIDNLKAMRNTYFNMLFLATGGSTGLVLTEMNKPIYWFLLAMGLFIMFLALKQARQKSKEIDELIRSNENDT